MPGQYEESEDGAPLAFYFLGSMVFDVEVSQYFFSPK